MRGTTPSPSLYKVIPAVMRINEQMRTSRFRHMTLKERCDMYEKQYEIPFSKTGGLLSEAFLAHPAFKDCRDAYVFFVFSLDDVASICETKDVNRLMKLLDTNAFQLSAEEFRQFAEDDITIRKMEKSSQGEHVFAYVGSQIFLTHNSDVKKATGVIRKDTFEMSKMSRVDFEQLMRKKIPDISISDEFYNWIHSEEGRRQLQTLLQTHEPSEKTMEEFHQLTLRSLRTCTACQKRGISLPKCTCKEVYYCNAECQKRDWSTHKKSCSVKVNKP